MSASVSEDANPFSDRSAIALQTLEEIDFPSNDLEASRSMDDVLGDGKSVLAVSIAVPSIINSAADLQQSHQNFASHYSSANGSDFSIASAQSHNISSIRSKRNQVSIARANTADRADKQSPSPPTQRRVSLLPASALGRNSPTQSNNGSQAVTPQPPSRMLSPTVSGFLAQSGPNSRPSKSQRHEKVKPPASFAELTAAQYTALQRAFETNNVDLHELVARINLLKDNSVWAHANSNDKHVKHLNPRRTDISLIPIQGMAIVKKRGIRRLIGKIKRILDCDYSDPAVDPEHETRLEDELKPDYFPPPPPATLVNDDSLSLAIHYHEEGNLRLSAWYLKKAAVLQADDTMNPLALYLLALTRRHGWGLALDKHKAFLELTLCVEKLILMIPGLVQIKLQHGEEMAESVFLVQAPSRDASDSNLQMNHRNSSLSLWKQRRLSRASNGVSSAFSLFSVTSSHQEVLSLDDAMNMLPLPLFEIAVSLMQGWGVPKSIPAAMYFYKVAATLGDVDAMFDLGYLNLKLGNKMEAAVWLRDAVAGGRELTGETWIFKRKWGGDGR